MNHYFDMYVAQTFGVNESIFLQNIAYWVHHNMSNDLHLHEGKYWTYNSQKAFGRLFPYWTRQNLRTIIKSCIDQNLIVAGNHNENKYDQTSWYTLTDLGLSLFKCFDIKHNPAPYSEISKESPIGENQPIECLEPTTPLVETNQCIYDSYNKPNNKPNNKRTIKITKSLKTHTEKEIVMPDWIDKQDWEDFKQHRQQMKKPLTFQCEKRAIAKLAKLKTLGHDPKDVINESIINGWSGLFEIRKVTTLQNIQNNPVKQEPRSTVKWWNGNH